MKRRIPLFDGWLHTHNNREEWDRVFVKLCKEGDYDPQSALPQHQVPRDGLTASVVLDGVLHIVSGVFTKNPDERGEVANHEATHCAQDLACHCEIDPLKEIEAFAYLSTYFYKELMK